jgi:hypothetical protein
LNDYVFQIVVGRFQGFCLSFGLIPGAIR